MGVSTSPEQLAHKLYQAGERIKAEADRTLMAAAKAGAVSMQASVRAAIPSGRLRNVGKAGAAVGAKAQSYGAGRISVKATGPLAIVDQGTKAHDIKPKRNRRGKGKGAIVINGSPRASAHHPGTHGKHIWAQGEPAALKAATEVQQKSEVAIMREVFG